MKRKSMSSKRGSQFFVMPIDELSDAEEYRLYTACHWPFHVWKRTLREAQDVQNKLVGGVQEGLARVRVFRRWSVDAAIFSKERSFGKRVRQRARRHYLETFFTRLARLGASRYRFAKTQASGQFQRLRSRCVCWLPLRALRAYAVCRALVRARSLGEMMLRREAKVPPLPIPPEWRVMQPTRPIVEHYTEKDVAKRVVHRHCRQRLMPLLLRSLAFNVGLQRRKRFARAHGYLLVYMRCFTQWSLCVALGSKPPACQLQPPAFQLQPPVCQLQPPACQLLPPVR